MKNSIILLFASFTVLMSSCTVGRYLDEKAYIYVENGSDIVFRAESNKYLTSTDSEFYYLTFMREFDDAVANYNIELLSTYDLKKENLFICDIESFIMAENYSIENIYTDSLSVFAETYKVTSCSVDLEFDLYCQSLVNKEHIKQISAYSSDEEKLNTNRTFWQILFGLNKDNSEYTYHELSTDVYDDLIRKAARKSAAKISKAISKHQKY